MRKFNFKMKDNHLRRLVVFLLAAVMIFGGLLSNIEAKATYNTGFAWDKEEEALNEWHLDENLKVKTHAGIGTAGFSYSRFYQNEQGRIVLEIDFSIFPDAPNNETSGHRTFREQWDNALFFIDPNLQPKVDVGESFFMMSYPLEADTISLNKANISGNIYELKVTDVFPKMPAASDYMKSKLYLVLKSDVARDDLNDDYALELRYTNAKGQVYEQRGSQGAQVLGNYNYYPGIPPETNYDITVNNDDVTLKTIAPFKTATMPNAIPNPVLPPDMMRTVGQSVIYDNIRGKLHVYYKEAPNHYIRGSYADKGDFLSSKIGIRQVMDERLYDALKPDDNGVVGQMMMLSMNGTSWVGNVTTEIKKNEFSYIKVTNDVGTRSYMMVPQGFKTDTDEKAIAPTDKNLKNVYLHGHRKEADYVRFIYDVDKNKMDALFGETNNSTFNLSTSYITDRPTETTQTEYRLEAGQDGIVIPKGAEMVFDVPKTSRSVFKTGSGNNYERIIGNMRTKRPASEMNHYNVDPNDFGAAYTITPYIATKGGYVLKSETGLTVPAGEPISLTMFDASSPETVKMTVIDGTEETVYILNKYQTDENKLYIMPNANVRSGIIINRSANTPHVNEFFTDSVNITGHSKYANAFVSAREAKAVAADEEAFNEVYSSANSEPFEAEGKTLDGYPFTLDIPSQMELKKDTAIRFSNAAPGYFRSAPSTYKTQAKVTFNQNGGNGEDADRIVPINEKAYGEEGYSPNGFEGDNILWLNASGEAVPADSGTKYLSDYEGRPIKDTASDAYKNRQFSEDPTRDGYTFLGWSTKKTDSMGAADFQAMSKLTDVSGWDEETNYQFTKESPVDRNRTVYAVWEKNLDTYRFVLHDNNGGDDVTHTVDIPLADINGNTAELTAYLKKEGNVLFDKGFKKDDAYFVGWSEDETVSPETKVHELYTNSSKIRINEEKLQLQLNEEPVEPVQHTNDWQNVGADIINENGIATIHLHAQYKPLNKMTATKNWYAKGEKEIYEADPENYAGEPLNPAPFENKDVAMVLMRTTEGKTLDPTKYEIVEGFYSKGINGEKWTWAPQEGHDANGRKYSYLMTEFHAQTGGHSEEAIIEHFNKHRTWASMYITMIGQSDNLSKYTAISFVDSEDNTKSYMAVATSNQPEAVEKQFVNSTEHYKFQLKNFEVDVLPAIIHRVQANHNKVVIDRPKDGAKYLYFRLSDTATPVQFYKFDDGKWKLHPENPPDIDDIDIDESEDEGGQLIISSSTETQLSFEDREGQRVYALFTSNREDKYLGDAYLPKYASREIMPYNDLPDLEDVKQEPHIKDENGEVTHNVISAKIPAGSYAGAEYTLGYMDGANFIAVTDEKDDAIKVKPDDFGKLTFKVPTGKLNETTPYIIRGVDPAKTHKDKDFDGPGIDLTAPEITASKNITIKTGDLIGDDEGKITSEDPKNAQLNYKITKGGEEAALPDGIAITLNTLTGNKITGNISGTTADTLPAELLGDYKITITAEDVFGNVSTETITLTINQKATTDPIESITQSANNENGDVVLTVQGKKNAKIKLYSEKDGAYTEIDIPEVSGTEITNEDGTKKITISQADISRFNGGKVYVTQKMENELESKKVDKTDESINRAENKMIATGGAIDIDNHPPTPLQMLNPKEGTNQLKITNISSDENPPDVEDIDKIDLQIGETLKGSLIRQYDEAGQPTGVWKCGERTFTETNEEVEVVINPSTGDTEIKTVGVLNYTLPDGKHFEALQNITAVYYDYLGNASVPVTTSVLKLPDPVAPYNMTAFNYSKIDPVNTIIKGKADPGAEVSIKIGEQTYTAPVDELGDFTLKVPKQDEGKNLTVTSELNNKTAEGTVTVRSAQADKYAPVAEDLTIEEGGKFDLTKSVKVENYEEDSEYPGEPEFEDITPAGDIDVNTPGEYTGKVEVTYPDGSSEVVDVNVIVKANVIDVTDDPTQATPEGYVRVTVDAGEGTKLADGQETKFYNVKKGSSLKTSHYPTVEVTEGYEEPITWSVEAGTAIDETVEIVSTAKEKSIEQPDVIDVTDDPTQATPEGYVRVTVDAGEGTKLADGQETKFYNVKKGSFLAESHYPTVEVTEGYEEPITWSVEAGTAIDEAVEIVSTAKKTKVSDKIDPKLPDKTKVKDKNKLTSEEKAELKKKILEANKNNFPEGTEIEIADNGDTIITYPDGSKDTISGSELVVEKTQEQEETEPSETEPSETEPSETEPSESDPSESDSPKSDPSKPQHGEKKTGDSNGIYLWLIMMILSAGGLILVVMKKISSTKKE